MFFRPVFALPLALSLTLLAPGCARFVPRPLDPAARAAELSARRLDGRTWTLEALCQEAIRTHPDVKLAKAQYETARAAIETAGERPNPTIALAPQFTAPQLIEGTYAVDFDWTIETAGKRSRRLSVAHENARAAAARVVDAAWKVRIAARKAVLDLWAAEARGRLLGGAIAQQAEVLQSLGQRVEAGAEPRTVSAQPRLLQAQLRLQAAEAARLAALARAALAEALGMGTGGLAGARFSFAELEKVPGPRLAHRRAALTHRADILAALADYAAAEATLRLEIAKQYPDVHVNPGYALDSNVNKFALGLSITLPVLNHNGGAIAEAEAKRKEAAAKFEVVQAKVLAECDRAAAAVQAARAKLAVADQLLAEQGKQIGTEERLLAAGAGDKVSLGSARVERATTEAARLDALVELQAAVGALEDATQTRILK